MYSSRLVYQLRDVYKDTVVAWQRLLETVYARHADLNRSLTQINNSLVRFTNEAQRPLARAVDLALDYLINMSAVKRPLAELITSSEIEAETQALKAHFSELREIAGEAKTSYWSLYRAMQAAWSHMLVENRLKGR